MIRRVIVLNLPRRGDRLAAITENLRTCGLAFDVLPAYDGTGAPKGWGNGRGSFGCLMSHLSILRMVRVPTLVLEDDAVLPEDAKERIAALVANTPPGWGQIYLGGSHHAIPCPPVNGVARAKRIARTYAYLVDPGHAPAIVDHIEDSIIRNPGGISVSEIMANGHSRRLWPVYAADPWIAVHRDGNDSDIRQHP